MTFRMLTLLLFFLPLKLYSAECTAYERIHPTYPLTNAHLSTGKCTSCGLCHINSIFVGTPKTCIACHNGDPRRQTVYRSAKHLPTLLIDCGMCHNTIAFTNWTGMTQTKIHMAYPSIRCDSCHNGSYRTPYNAWGKNNGHPTSYTINGVRVLVTSVDCNYCHSMTKTDFGR